MAGSYCKFCYHRCFVSRRMPADAKWRPGEVVHLATCPGGAAHDLRETGYDYRTALDPSVLHPTPWTVRRLGTAHGIYDAAGQCVETVYGRGRDDEGKGTAERIVNAINAAARVEVVCAKHEWGATRWADPLPIPSWIDEVRAALAGEGQ